MRGHIIGTEEQCDLLIVGGGVNGCSIARDAAGRGLSVVLVEQGDLASATSSASTKLIHGGLRYLEYYEFRLVREALIEREVLLRAAPHFIWPLRFVLPHHKGLRPRWLIRLGLFLYDHLGGRKLLPGTRSIDLRTDPAGQPLKPSFTHAFEYSDCWVEDARLVVANARDAMAKGASIRTRTRCTGAIRDGASWRIDLEDIRTRGRTQVRARALLNAAGPWVGAFLRSVAHDDLPATVRLVRGSHIVTRRLFTHDRCYIFQNSDGRICFAIPYENDYTLIGTTDEDYQGDPAAVAITEAEIDYLLGAVSQYLREPVARSAVVWTYSGVRPLYDDGASAAQAATRDYVLKLDHRDDGPPLLSVFGGKITTARRLAEAALAKLDRYFPAMRPAWTAAAHLPGGDFAPGDVPALVARLRQRYPFIDERHASRLVRYYGTEAEMILADARSPADLGRHLGADLFEREVRWIMANELAIEADDILWRRSKLGLRMTAEERRSLADWLDRMTSAELDAPAGLPT